MIKQSLIIIKLQQNVKSALKCVLIGSLSDWSSPPPTAHYVPHYFVILKRLKNIINTWNASLACGLVIRQKYLNACFNRTIPQLWY